MGAATPLPVFTTSVGGGDVTMLLYFVLPVWLLGTLVGLLLPRPKWLETWTRTSSMLLPAPMGVVFRRTALLCHAGLIVRDVWRNFTAPGTFRKLLHAAWQWLTGGVVSSNTDAATASQRDIVSRPIHDDLDWSITETDLQFFQRHAEDDTTPPGYTDWELMMRKSFGTEATYTAWRRTMPSGKTEYKSITVARDVSPEEFNDFYLDDHVRAAWDSMLTSHESVARVMDPDLAAHRMQVVHWKRSFPFSFISARDYVIGRRTFRQHGNVYGMTKAIEHDHKPPVPGVVRMKTFHSMWRCRAVACPFGTDAPACETLLLHHEDFQIPENLARFAVRAGMGGFIKKMVPAVRPFVNARRQRVAPMQRDLAAFGLEGVFDGQQLAAQQQQAGLHHEVASTTDDSISTAGSAAPADECDGLSELPDSPRSTTRSTTLTTCIPTNKALRRARTAPGALLDTLQHSPSTASLASSMGGGSSVGGDSTSLPRVGSVRKLATLALAAGVAVAVSQSTTVGVVRSPSFPGGSGGGHRRGRRGGSGYLARGHRTGV